MRTYDKIRAMIINNGMNNHIESFAPIESRHRISPKPEQTLDLYLQAHALTGRGLYEIVREDDIRRTKAELLEEAYKKSGDNITPCTSKKSFAECYTIESKCIIFWYNIRENTHTLKKCIHE